MKSYAFITKSKNGLIFWQILFLWLLYKYKCEVTVNYRKGIMRIFSLMPAYQSPQANRNQSLNHSQNSQQSLRLKALSHDQVSFKGKRGIEKLLEKKVIITGFEELLPNSWKKFEEDIKDLLLCKIRQRPRMKVRFSVKMPTTERNPYLSIYLKEQESKQPWSSKNLVAVIPCSNEVYHDGRRIGGNIGLDFDKLQKALSTAVYNFHVG